ncbi:hypothetical protein TIFTF001_035769 [Ficus carica]|uniref:Uncharacterized protein n=1 Tax=Ficus carica TaxID=3494 RepID=A0AA88E2Y2_FICCA|nr:hypothetical protein TIFTF001_035769 [Ficus carica]
MFQIDGTLVAPPDYRIPSKADNWPGFHTVSGVSIVGGALDARGAALRACKATASDCPKNLWIEHISCGPGHGISIGSLAKELKEEGVQLDS